MRILLITVLALISVVLTAGCLQETRPGGSNSNNTTEATQVIIQNKEVFTSCSVDDDCTLIDKELGFGCCWAGACGEVDYSKESYVAVNEKSFLGLKEKNCPKECGPAPGCPSFVKNDRFAARCINSACKKAPLENNSSKNDLGINSVFGDHEGTPEQGAAPPLQPE